jgi:catechol 2,3-dioxygenase-like lactoylglutathione lyase family enzyme
MNLQHVSIPRPPDGLKTALEFYGGLLGLRQIPVPNALAGRDLVWFGLDKETELHIFPEEPAGDKSARHLCLVVEDLEDVRQRLTAAGYRPWDPIYVPGRPRFFCKDPFGNQLEFTVIEGDYRTLG